MLGRTNPPEISCGVLIPSATRATSSAVRRHSALSSRPGRPRPGRGNPVASLLTAWRGGRDAVRGAGRGRSRVR